MQEIELRFQIPPEQRRPLLLWLKSAGSLRRERLQAAYFDTAARDLARAGFALRLRREGRRWVQTLKGEAPDGMTRLEHNVTLGQGAAMPALDVARHAAHPAGAALLARVAELGGEAALLCLFRTDIRRHSVQLTQDGSVLELALDEGQLLADAEPGQREAPVLELEIELKSGSPAALLQLAREAVSAHGLWLEHRSKALRGDLLARAQPAAPPALATAAPWRRGSSAQQALKQLLQAALEPLLGNASQIASGSHAPEHLHQLRVGLLRLMVCLQLLQGLPAKDDGPQEQQLRALRAAAQALRRSLSAARDADVQARTPWQTSLDAAWRATGLSDDDTAAAADARPRSSAAELLRSAEAQALLLELLALLSSAGGSSPESPPRPGGGGMLRRACQARLARWQATLQDSGKQITGLAAEDRHRLRQRLRRLRYALEQTAELLPGAKTDSQLQELKQLHQQLGELNDLEQALQQARQQAGQQRRLQAAFALGYLHQEHALRLQQADASWRRWRKRRRR